MAFGKKNNVRLDPLAYNICLLGESKVGKTTLMKEVCEKLAGDGGYLFLECGTERGADAIQGINYINCPEWDMDYDELTNSAGLADVCEDIIENKTSEYPNLKAVIFDTYDHLIDIAEQKSIDMWNKECRNSGHAEKCVKSINQAWSGYGRGEKKAIEIMFDMMARLRNVGVASIIIGHVKTKEISDVVSGESYQILTSDQQQNYFNALKKNLHFLGLAYIDRDVIKEKTGRKNAVTKKDEVVNKVASESRKIKFRDDNYAVDSGSRFANIIPEIDMNADAFIQALTDAIKSEQSKSGVSLDAAKKKQAKQEKELEKRVAEQEEQAKSQAAVDEVVSQIVDFFTENKSDIAKIKPVLTAVKNLGYDNPKSIDNVEDANKILALISE